MEPELITVAGEAASQGGCVLCTSPDFLRGGFGDRTMIICDQCEREFHIGCLAEHGRARLTELPDGAPPPPCRTPCSRCHARHASARTAGARSENTSWSAVGNRCPPCPRVHAGAWFCSPDCHRIAGKMRSNVSSVPVPLDDKYSWQILRGKDGTHATAWALRAAQVGHFIQKVQLVDLDPDRGVDALHDILRRVGW